MLLQVTPTLGVKKKDKEIKDEEERKKNTSKVFLIIIIRAVFLPR